MPNEEARSQITKLVEKFTTASHPEPAYLKHLKSICKKDEENVVVTHQVVIAQLRRPHTVVRLNCLQVIDQLFHRSHRFRTLLLEDFHQFSILTLGYEADKALPPPQSQHKKLITETIGKIKEWHRKFKSGYNKLELSFNVLKNHVDFEEVCLINDSLRKIRLEKEERLNNIWRERVRRVGEEFAEYRAELDSWRESSDNLLSLLSDGNCLANYQEEVEGQYNVLVRRLLPKVQAWTVTLTKAGNLADSDLLRQAVEHKQKLTESLHKFEKFNIAFKKENSDDQLVKEKKSNSVVEVDPTTWEATVLKVTGEKIDLNIELEDKTSLKTDDGGEGCSSSSSIPRLEDVQFPTEMVVDPDKSRFWVSDGREGEIVSVGGIQRVTEFVGSHGSPADLPRCGARLPSGGVCPRRDKVKCPLHGPIIGRGSDDSDTVNQTVITASSPGKRKIERNRLKAAVKYDESSRSRIEKKIFNKSSAKRVSKDLTRYDKLRTKNKFTDQFNY